MVCDCFLTPCCNKLDIDTYHLLQIELWDTRHHRNCDIFPISVAIPVIKMVSHSPDAQPFWIVLLPWL
jgi:hypothetical protein